MEFFSDFCAGEGCSGRRRRGMGGWRWMRQGRGRGTGGERARREGRMSQRAAQGWLRGLMSSLSTEHASSKSMEYPFVDPASQFWCPCPLFCFQLPPLPRACIHPAPP